MFSVGPLFCLSRLETLFVMPDTESPFATAIRKVASRASDDHGRLSDGEVGPRQALQMQ